MKTNIEDVQDLILVSLEILQGENFSDHSKRQEVVDNLVEALDSIGEVRFKIEKEENES